MTRVHLKGEELPDACFDPDQLATGIEIELEHTDDPEVAKAIAKGHLIEHPRYYDYLERMESAMRGNPSKRHVDLYSRWHGHGPREERKYDASFATSYGLVGKRAMRLDYVSTKLIEENDAGEPHAYKHDFEPDCQPCKIWSANETGKRLVNVPARNTALVQLGWATRLDWEAPDGEIRGMDWGQRSALLCAIDGRRWCILEPRRRLVTFIGTNSRVTAEGIADRKR